MQVLIYISRNEGKNMATKYIFSMYNSLTAYYLQVTNFAIIKMLDFHRVQCEEMQKCTYWIHRVCLSVIRT
jgi:hypothetical protein